MIPARSVQVNVRKALHEKAYSVRVGKRKSEIMNSRDVSTGYFVANRN